MPEDVRSAVGHQPGGMADEEVVRLIRNGDVDKYEILGQRYSQRLYRIARAIVRDEYEAEDIVQDAFVRAFASLARFRGDAAFSTWLTRIAMHEALARKRGRSRLSSLQAVAAAAPISSDVTPEDVVTESERVRLVEEAIDALPKGHRVVFMLRAVEGLSNEEVATSPGISEGNVRVRMNRARKLLREALGPDFHLRARGAFRLNRVRCGRISRAALTRIHAGLSALRRPA